MRLALAGLALIAAATARPSAAIAQATARPCDAAETPGPACLLAHQMLPALPGGPVFWQLDRFATRDAADAARTPSGSVVEAFGAIWLFTIADGEWRPRGGDHVATIGPLPAQPAPHYAAEYLRSIFPPGTTAPLHVHSGPEAFYAVSGDTCLETPDGVRIGRGPGNSLLIRGGPADAADGDRQGTPSRLRLDPPRRKPAADDADRCVATDRPLRPDAGGRSRCPLKRRTGCPRCEPASAGDRVAVRSGPAMNARAWPAAFTGDLCQADYEQ